MTIDPPPFTPVGLQGLLQGVAAAGYTFRRFDAEEHPDDSFFLRFDVDISPRSARTLGRIVADSDAVGTFFFMLNGETYDIFSDDHRATITELRDLGHAVGLHIDQNVVGDSQEAVAATVSWFSTYVTEIDSVVSFHRPTPSVLGRHYEHVTSAYAPSYFSPDRYFSDSRRSADFVPRLQAALAENTGPLQLLLHPEWWFEVDDVAHLYDTLLRRRRCEFDRFLTTNFNKVFSPIVPLENLDADRAPRV